MISIITVTYNAADTFEQAIQSIACQSVPVEYIVIDGGSTDSTIEIAERNRDLIDVFVSEPDNGIYDAINKGIDRSTGEWLFFLGADDKLAEGILVKVIPYLQPNLAVVYGDVMFDTGYVMHSRINMGCLLDNKLHHQGTFYHRKLFDGFRYNQKFRIYADYELTLRIYLQKQPSLYLPYIISTFATGGSSHKLESNDINTIRGLYLKNTILNHVLSLILNVYYPYVIIKPKIAHEIKKILKLGKKCH